MLEIRCFHRMSEAAPFREAMNALNLAAPDPDPFSTYEFLANIAASAEAFPSGDGFRPWLLLAFDGTMLVGYAALKQERHRVLGVMATRIDWLAAYVIGRPHLVAHRTDATAVSEAIYAYLMERSQEWSLLAFEQQDADSRLLPPPLALRVPRYHLSSWPDTPHWRIPLQGHSLKSYFSSFSVKFRSNVSRQMRALMAEGRLELLTASTPDARVALFALYREIERNSWKPLAGVDVGHDARALAYFQGLMSEGQPMQVIIQLLVLDDLPVAGLISGAFGDGMYALEMVYDARFAALGPGTAMMFLGIRHAIEGKYASYDLLRDFGHHKARWNAEPIENRTLQIFRVGTPYFWRRCIGNLRRGMAPMLKSMGWGRNAHPLPARTERAAPVAADARSALDGLGGGTKEAAERCRLLIIGRNAASEHLVDQTLANVLPFPVTVNAAERTGRMQALAPLATADAVYVTQPVYGGHRPTAHDHTASQPRARQYRLFQRFHR